MKRKILFVVFSDDGCRLNHVFMYASDLHSKGHEVKVILEGVATRCLSRLDDRDSRFTKLFLAAQEKGLVAGACMAASSGCANEGESKISDLASKQKIALLADMQNHAGISSYIEQGYELVTI